MNIGPGIGYQIGAALVFTNQNPGVHLGLKTNTTLRGKNVNGGEAFDGNCWCREQECSEKKRRKKRSHLKKIGIVYLLRIDRRRRREREKKREKRMMRRG